jgi:hypothetical protein
MLMPPVTDDLVPAEELDIASMQLGIDDLEFALQTREQVRSMAYGLAAQAQRELLLHTEDVEAEIFNQQPFLDGVSRLVRQHQAAHVWILVENSRKTIQQGHRLIELSRRLGSHIQFRCPPRQYRNYGKTFLLCDDAGYLYRPLASRYEGTANFNNPGQTAVHKKYFMEVWEQSQADEEMRRLHL